MSVPTCGDYDFAMADKAYGLMSLSEKRRVLEIMATLSFPSVTDRFFEAVSLVIEGSTQEPSNEYSGVVK